MRKKSKRSENVHTREKILSAIIIVAIIVTLIISLAVKNVTKQKTSITDPAILRAMTYTQYTDDDGHKEVYAVDSTTGEVTDTVVENVEFSAFFLQDLDGDGTAEILAGTCNEVGSNSTLYMEINVLTQGCLENAVITIDGENFYLQTAIPADGEIKSNAISSNTSNIYFNTINNGTQKLITGNVRSGNYNSISQKLAALSNNINNYSAISTVTLTGTYVAEDGTRTQISKTSEITVDWYNTPVASMPSYIADEENLNQTQSLTTAIDEEAGTFTVNLTVGMEETAASSLLSGAYIYGVIPDLNGYSATNAKITGTNVTYTWNAETQEYTAQVLAQTDDDGNIISNAYYGTYSSGGTYYRYNYFDFSITYPLEAYKSVGRETIVYQLTANGYYMAYNNSFEEFDNPVQSNIATGTFVTTIEVGAGSVISFDVKVGTYRNSYPERWVVSKENPLSIYNGYTESDEVQDTYLVTWSISRGSDNDIDGLIIAETQFEEETKTADYFTASTGELISMEDVTTNIGIYFEYAVSMLGEDGWIKIYNDETDELLVTFTNDGSDNTENWNDYSSSDPYYYAETVSHIRLETSETNSSSSLKVYNVKEIDDEYITTNYSAEYFDTLSYVSSTLVGYVIYGGTTEAEYVKTDVDNAYYEAPYAYASFAIKQQTTNETLAFDTQAVEEGAEITITTNTDAYNQVKWINGSFLIEMPEDIIDVQINSVSIDNEDVTIINYEKYEEDGKIYIKVDTENEEETSYKITINADITPNPKVVTQTESVILYYYNENAVAYANETSDTYDINNNLSTEDTIGKASLGVNLVAPSSLLTFESVTNYDDEGSETLAPNVAEVTKAQETADINVEITNNYSSTISGIVILGRVPYEGNTYVINGGDLGSTFTVAMQEGGIEIPEGLTGTVYYSTNETATKDLTDESNGWVTADEVEDWSEIKSYLIDISENVLQKGDSYMFTYTAILPSGLDYNEVTYSHHAIWFNLDTENGKYATYTEPNKVGIMVAKRFELELTKYQSNTEYLVPGATYQITDLTTGDTQTALTGSDGTLTFTGIYVEREYTIQEIKSPSEYELSSDIITFNTSEVDGEFVLTSTDGNVLSIEASQTEDGTYVVKVEVEDDVKATIQIVKTDEKTGATLSGARFQITGKNYANGKVITTNSNGTATLSGLTIGETYTIEEIKTKSGYYLLENTITFEVLGNEDNTYYINIISDANNATSIGEVTYSNGVPTVTLNIKNEEIPTYTLELTKIKEDDEETVLEGARFELYSEDTGNYEYLYTDSNGILTFTGLYNYVNGKYITGKYTLREINAPDGYALNDETIEFYVQLNDDGSQTINITNEDSLTSLVNYEISDDIIKITVSDCPLFVLTKVSADDNTVTLEGAKFIIYETNVVGIIQDYAKDVSGNYVGEQDENGDYIITTDENGQYSVGLKGGFYVAVEVEAPDGYALAEDTYFTIEGYDSYEINSMEEFLAFASDGNTYEGEIVELTTDLDFSGIEYTPKEEFDGTFLGNGHKISNLTLSTTSTTITKQYLYDDWDEAYTYGSECYGLFATTDGATITGLVIENPTVDITVSDIEFEDLGYGYVENYIVPQIGMIVGNATDTTIQNCYIAESNTFNIDIDGVYDWCTPYVGSLVGGYEGDLNLINCYNNSDIEINVEEENVVIGGLVGNVWRSTGDIYINNCYNSGDITTNIDYTDYFGGIIGQVIAQNITITNCYNSGNINVDYVWNAGGIVGYLESEESALVENCYNVGAMNITALYSSGVAGVIGYIEGVGLPTTYVNNCYNEGNITVSTSGGSPNISGVVASASNTKIDSCYNSGDIYVTTTYNSSSSNDGVAGITGMLWAGSVMTNCYNTGDVTEYATGSKYISRVGGLVGSTSIYSGNYATCYIVNSYNKGTVTTSLNGIKETYVGGIIGSITRNACYIINVYNSGDIVTTEGSTNAYSGGIIGYATDGKATVTYGYYLTSTALQGVGNNTATTISMISDEMESTDFVTTLNSNAYEYSSTYDLLYWSETNDYPEFETDLSFELNISITEDTTEQAVTEVIVEDASIEHIITTEVAENSEGERAGGTVTGVYNDDYLEENYIEYVETVQHKENAITNIVVTPDEGYVVYSITLDGEAVSYIPDSNGVVTLEALENVTEDHHYVVTFERGKGQIIVHHILVDENGNIAYDEDENIIYVADDELQTGDIGEGYTTSPQMDLTQYEIATNVEVSSELREDDGTGADDDYYIPSNSYGKFEEEIIEITYYYVEIKVPLTVYHYIVGTETFVPTSSDDVETEEHDTGKVGDEYNTDALTEEELDERYELVTTPANANGEYEYDEVIVIYYYALIERDLSLVKTNEDGATLAGVKFKITGADEYTEGYEEEYTTNSSGKITETLEYGTYTIQETETLEGYQLDEIVYTISVTKDGISIVIADGTTLLETNSSGAYVLSIENSYIKGTVIVHHLIYDESLEDPHTEDQVPSKDGGTVENETTTDKVGEIYATQKSNNVAPNYEYVECSDNTSGKYIDGTIHVYYYYKIKESSVTSTMTKTGVAEDGTEEGSATITYKGQSITYTINYTATINDYYGDSTVTIVDSLPYEIEDGYSYTVKLDGSTVNITATYDSEAKTLTWVVPVEGINTYDEDGNNISDVVTVEITLTISYVDVDFDSDITNEAEGTIELSLTEQTAAAQSSKTMTQKYVTTVEVRKLWDDNEDAKGHRPESVTIILLANGETAYDYDGNEVSSAELTEENEWKYMFTNLPKYDSDGNTIEYTVEETETTAGDLEYYVGAEITNGDEYIEVKNSYQSKETGLEAEVTKTGTEKITSANEKVTYTIEYTAKITEYIGEATLTVVDTLPYGIVEKSSDLSEGVYNSNTNTITWKVDLGHINTDVNGDFEVTFEKTITVVYGENLKLPVSTMVNDVTAKLYLTETEETCTVQDDVETEVEIPGRVIVTYIDINTGEEIEEEVDIEGMAGDDYTTEQKDIDKYVFVKSTNNTEGTMIEGTIYVIYYYTKIPTDVHVTYVDIDTREEIADDERIEGYVDDGYTTEQKVIDYYVYVTATDNTEGTMEEETIEVIYYYTKLKFNMSIDKVITGITKNGTRTSYNNDSAKVEVGRKEIGSTTITVEYKITVTNTAEIAGTGTVIDYIPEYFTVSNSNPSYWTIDSDGNLTTTVSLEAGESIELTVLLDWVEGENNFGTTTNTAKIVDTTNPANFAETTTEDNEDSAKVILSVKTGWDTVKQISPWVLLALCGIALVIIVVKKNKSNVKAKSKH